MTNTITLKSINDILEKNFYIPSYQRGYRWTNQNVEDLLNDIYTFSRKRNKSEQEFYCLQPIVVKKLNPTQLEERELESEFDNNDWYEVVDGQQRLTTIRILLAYLVKKHLSGETLKNEYGKSEFQIEYETRKNSKEFLQEPTESNETIDLYHISEAYKAIDCWFQEHEQQRSVRESLLRTLVHTMENKEQEGIVQIIWYEINDSTNPIETFIRINMGKIPLTNSELIKALFLQKRNFEDKEIAELRQIEIASEWDRMEYTFQNDDFWWFLNKDKNDIPARIEFLLDLICKIAINKDESIIKKIGTDKHATFRYFYNKFSNGISIEDVVKEWNDIKDYFLAFEEWYEKPIWYHYIGFLIYCGNDISDIYDLYRNTTKERFTQKLKNSIKSRFEKVKCEKMTNNESVETFNIELEFSNKNKPKIRELLLLYNLQFIINQHENILDKNNAETYLKFPFKIFKEENWDVEHIDSFTSNTLTSYEIQKEWLNISFNDLKKINNNIDPDLESRINDFTSNTESNIEFSELRNEIIKLAGEVVNNEDVKNGIGNLTLLNADINRSYGNSLFPTKRRVIIEKDNEGKFIPICTKHVFLKYFDKHGISLPNWKEEDIINYQNNIGEILSFFLNAKTK
ncbi:MAG: hypothetical protein PWQ06_1239 [Anaerophaga sp.]|nr:hypothetical protein [Anaerophaga sp.]